MKVREILSGIDANSKVVVMKNSTRHTDEIVVNGVVRDVTGDVFDLVVRYSYVKNDVLLGAIMFICCEKEVA